MDFDGSDSAVQLTPVQVQNTNYIVHAYLWTTKHKNSLTLVTMLGQRKRFRLPLSEHGQKAIFNWIAWDPVVKWPQQYAKALADAIIEQLKEHPGTLA